MADSKSAYSNAAYVYAMRTRHYSMVDALRYYRSKVRESMYNESWKKNMVNLNDVVKQFTPGVKGQANGVKFEFKNAAFIVKVDMPSGYLRIQDRKTGDYLKLDGTPGNRTETHFKIKKRSEM